MYISTPLLPFALSLLSLTSAQDHPAISPGPSANFKPDLISRLPPAKLQGQNIWDNAWIPEACYRETVSRGFSPWDVEVRNIRYGDCDRDWAVCRHNRAAVGWDAIIQNLARVPVGMRQYAGNALIVPDGNGGGCATVAAGYIVITTSGCWVTDVLFHELTHTMDRWATQDLLVQNGYARDTISYSQSWMWLGAYNRDSHVVTDYARSAQHENFAELAIFATSDKLTPGGVGVYIGSRRDLVNDQLGNWRVTMEPHIWTSDGRCNGAKKGTTRAVSKNTGLRKREKKTRGVKGLGWPVCGLSV